MVGLRLTEPAERDIAELLDWTAVNVGAGRPPSCWIGDTRRSRSRLLYYLLRHSDSEPEQ